MNVIGKIKKFNKKLYEKYDIPARNIMKDKLKDLIEDNPDIYGVDMILKIPDCKYKYLELQVCTNWINDKYPYQNPFIYARKYNFDEKTLYLILDRHMTQGLLFNKKSIIDKPKRLKKYSRYFIYEIPWHRILNIYMDNFDCETIKLYN
jgi:hypothetical protein